MKQKKKKDAERGGWGSCQCAQAIHFISQQSRFHLETLETPSKDIDIPGIQLSIGDTKLLEDAQLRLFSGVRYGLVGKNGVGKSTLMQAIGHVGLADFPKHLRILYVDQLEAADDSQSVLSLVLGADKQALVYKGQAERLEAATGEGDPEACARAVQQVTLERLEADLEEARQIATKRSGARGFDARHVLIRAENRVKEAQEALDKEVGGEALTAAPEAAQQLLEEVLGRLSLMEPEAAEAEARRILLGLGFSTSQMEGPLSKLSGGWRMRVALAQALFIKPDLLLFDEPTNHLDLPAILWLTRYLRHLEGVTLLLVSHDRTFLTAVTQETIVMKDHQLTYHDGNYDEYMKNKEEKMLHLSRMKEAVDKKRAHMEKSISEGLRAAKKSGDDKKLNMVASRKKKLEQRMGMERSAAGHRFQINKDLGGYHLTRRAEIVVEAPDPPSVWKLPEPAPLRQSGTLLQLEDVSFGYPTRPGFQRPVLSNVTMNVGMGDRIAVVGANGAGKSTLMKLMVGELQPSSGSVHLLPQARLGVFLQHHVEELVGKKGEGGTPLSHLAALYPGRKEQDLRGHLGSFQIKGHLATQPLSTLSGGQAVRVALAATTLGSPHLLVLDEPSNHLDLGGVESLLNALRGFSGAVVLVSHDQHLVNSFADVVYAVGGKRVRRLEGGMPEYVRELQAMSKKVGMG